MVANTRLYDNLGLAPDASEEQIKKAYRKGAVKHHPDKNPGDAEAAARFTEISEAYTVLMDAEKRRFYDETGEVDDAEVQPEDFYEQFQEVMADLMGGESVMEMVAGMSAAEIRRMPPFPFPKELFPPGTFPEGMRFSCDGLADLPPSMLKAIEAGDAAGLFGPVGGLAASYDGMLGGGGAKAGGGKSGSAGSRKPSSMPTAGGGVGGGSGRARRGGVKVGGAASRSRAGRASRRGGGFGGFGGLGGGFGGFEEGLFGAEEDDEEAMMMMMMDELAKGRLPPGMPPELAEELLQSMGDLGGLGGGLGLGGGGGGSGGKSASRFGKVFGGGLDGDETDDDDEEGEDEEALIAELEREAAARRRHTAQRGGGGGGGASAASLEANGGAQASPDGAAPEDKDAEKERKRKERNQRKKRSRQQKKEAAAAAASAVDVGDDGEGGGSTTGAAEVPSAASAAASGSGGVPLPAPSRRADLTAVLSEAAAAASAAFGEDEDEGTSGGEGDRGGGEFGGGGDADADEIVDAKGWLDAAKAGEHARLKAAFATHPALLTSASPGIGHTALHWAAARGHVKTLRWLLSVGAPAAQRNESGSTSLHAAAANGQLECARLLFEDEVQVLGACPLLSVRDADGRTAAAVAREHDHDDLASLLDAHTPSAEAAPRTTPPAATTSPSSGGGPGAGVGDLSQLERAELTCLIDVLSALGDRKDPPLTAQQASCVAKLGSMLFATRLHKQ